MANDKKTSSSVADETNVSAPETVKNLNVRKIIVGSVLVFSTIAGGIIYYLGTPKSCELRTFRSIVSDISIDPEYTVFDEVLAIKEEESGDYLPATLDFINELIDISNEINEFDLDSVVDIDKIDLPDLDDVKVNQEYLDLLKKQAYEEIRLYKKLKEEGVRLDSLSPDARSLRKCVKELYKYSKIINYVLNGPAWDKLSEFSLPEFKASIVDLMDESPEYINGIRVYPDGDRRYVDVNDHGDIITIDITLGDKEETVRDRIFKTSAVNKFANSIFDQQRTAALYDSDLTNSKYEKDNNDKLREAFNSSKLYLFTKIKQNRNGRLVPTNVAGITRLGIDKKKIKYKNPPGRKYGTN